MDRVQGKVPADISGLPESVTAANLPAGVHEGLNDWKCTGYGGALPEGAIREPGIG